MKEFFPGEEKPAGKQEEEPATKQLQSLAELGHFIEETEAESAAMSAELEKERAELEEMKKSEGADIDLAFKARHVAGLEAAYREHLQILEDAKNDRREAEAAKTKVSGIEQAKEGGPDEGRERPHTLH